uniref:Uncharacterized protein n=1 Tax=Arundo donax TaxID=35708 RepID=A0A0A9H9E0_ARUDO
MLQMMYPHLNLRKPLPILEIHPLRSARVFFHSISAGTSRGVKSQAPEVVSPKAQRAAGRHCLQLLQAALPAAA